MTFITRTTKLLITALVVTFVSTSVIAHERFIVPSHTLLSGDKPQSITLTASISNAIFHPDRPLGDSNTGADVGDLKKLFNILEHTVINPNGDINKGTKWQAFARMSVADVVLKDSGTYRIGLNQPDVYMTTFKKADGTPWRLFGTSPELPKGATDIVRRTTSSRVETFVTLNSNSDLAVKPTGNGVELAGETHPNDLFTNEPISFQLFFNGKPLTDNVNVKLIKSGTRHRNNRDEQKIEVSKEGKIDLHFTEAGFYFLGAETMIKTPEDNQVDIKHFSLYLTLEVLPE